ncbi:hypothetical protein ACFL1R_02075 [Candidatus Latescibacterota bacterium]
MRKLFIVMFLLAIAVPAHSQETKTLFGPETDIGFVWGIETKSTDIKGDIGTSIGFVGGALINHAYLVGLAVGANITHPEVNHGYLGVITQYTYKPGELIHCSGQLFLGTGTTKDYENKKSSTMDNFGNITGPGFYIIEPGVNAEVNMNETVRLLVGLSYRIVTGLDKDDDLISKTNVKSSDFSGFHINIGVKVGKY